jgi:starch synthase
MRIAFASSEMVPYAKTGGLADVAGSLPKALAALGHQVDCFLPYYGQIDPKKFDITPITRLSVPLGSSTLTATLDMTCLSPGVHVHLVGNDHFFHRDHLYGDEHGDYPDNAERFGFFCSAVLEALQHLDRQPEVFHINDWQTALIPVYMKAYEDPQLPRIPTIFTIHNLAYQGTFSREVLPLLGLGPEYFTMDTLEFWGEVNLMKGGLVFATVLNTVSEQYSREIQTKEYGYGLEGVLRQRKDDLFGILNGLDYHEWNPSTDPEIPARYDATSWKRKAQNKDALQKEVGLPPSPNIPLIGMITRLADQKGLDILSDALDHLLGLDLQLVLLGTGDPRYHQLFQDVGSTHPDKISVSLRFDPRLARTIYAASDLFLMPSRYEPCGLGQMISMRYGTIPIVRRTGGLADTVVDFDGHHGNGFSFQEYDATALIATVERALDIYCNQDQWASLIRTAMAADFSWERSAQQYIELYQLAVHRMAAEKG